MSVGGPLGFLAVPEARNAQRMCAKMRPQWPSEPTLRHAQQSLTDGLTAAAGSPLPVPLLVLYPSLEHQVRRSPLHWALNTSGDSIVAVRQAASSSRLVSDLSLRNWRNLTARTANSMVGVRTQNEMTSSQSVSFCGAETRGKVNISVTFWEFLSFAIR